MSDTTVEAGTQIHDLEAEAFQQTKTRVDKSARIRQDVKPTDGSAFSQQRVAEIRDIEMRSNQEGTGLNELIIDTRDGYQEQRSKVSYKSPDGTVITEELVFFIKPDKDGQPQWLQSADGRTLGLNGDLYDSRMKSRLHAQGVDYDSYTIPRIDGRGAYTGVVSLFKSK